MTDFEKFFADEFQRRLAAATVPGMTDPSWDRRAAWLLFLAEGRSEPARASLRSPEPVGDENRHVFKTPAPSAPLKGGLFD